MSTRKAQHNWQVLLEDRMYRRVLRQTLDKALVNNNNEILLTSKILSFLKGKCDKCKNNVSMLKQDKRYGNICMTCIKRHRRS